MEKVRILCEVEECVTEFHVEAPTKIACRARHSFGHRDEPVFYLEAPQFNQRFDLPRPVIDFPRPWRRSAARLWEDLRVTSLGDRILSLPPEC